MKLKKEKITKKKENVLENRIKTETGKKTEINTEPEITKIKTDTQNTKIETENRIRKQETEVDLVQMKIAGMIKETEEALTHVHNLKRETIDAEKN
jgi:hypothetical protein